ncbi:MAG: NB-ARC domain-containing protein [Caldilineaceae bacterium]
MALPSSLLERTHKAILAAYDRDELRQAVSFCLAWSLDVLTPDKALDEQVFALVVRVEPRGYLPQLLEYMAAERPHDPELAAVRDAVMDAYGNRPPTPRPIVGGGLGRCDFYRHVDLPATYVPRPEVLGAIKEVLLAPASAGAAALGGAPAMALTSAIKMDALQGMGGIGKSVIARALCDDPEVQEAFPGGILWAALGQAPNLVERLREWVERLGGTVRSNAPTAELLKGELQEALEGRSCLLILDDVWNKGDVAFFRPPSGSRLLLTTRDAGLAEDLGAAVLPIPVMDRVEALELLAGSIGAGHSHPTAAEGPAVVKRLGYLPLAIMLAGAQLRETAAGLWLEEFDAAELELQRPQSEHDSLTWTFDHSLRDLPEQKRGLYAALAVFPEDETLHPGAVARLWAGLAGLSEKQSVRLLHELVDRALVQKQRSGRGTGTGAEGQLVLHDLVRDFVVRELGGEGSAAAHAAILRAYRAAAPAGKRWPDDDGYLYDHLAYHLEKLARTDGAYLAELVGLFGDQEWMRLRFEQSGYTYDGYLADLDRCWQLRHEDLLAAIREGGDVGPAWADSMRFALIRSSIVSLAATYVPALILQAVRKGLWSVERAYSVSRHVPDPWSRSGMLLQVAGQELHNAERRFKILHAALVAAQTIKDADDRAVMLTSLALQLTGDLKEQALKSALTAAQAIEDERDRARVLTRLAPQLTGDLKEQALKSALTAAQAIEYERDRARALTRLAPQLKDEMKVQALGVALAMALAINDYGDRARALHGLAPQFTGEQRWLALQAAVTAADAIENAHDRNRVLTDLWRQLTGEQTWLAMEAAATEAQMFMEESYRARVLEYFVRQSYRNLVQRTAVLASLEQLPAELLDAALAATQTIEDDGSCVHVLSSLAAQAIEDYDKRTWMLTCLATQLTTERVNIALKAAQAIEDRNHRVRLLDSLAPQLTGELLETALKTAQAIEDKECRTSVLISLAPQLTGELLEAALTTRLDSDDEAVRTRVLSCLAAQLKGRLKDQVLSGILRVAQTIKDEDRRAEMLTRLAPQLAGEPLEAALAIALAIKTEHVRAWVLPELVPQLRGERKRQVLEAALSAAQAVGDDCLARVQTSLASQLPGEQVEAAMVAAQATGDYDHRAQVLTPLAPQLADEQVEVSLAAAQAIEYEGKRAEVLTSLATQLTTSAQRTAVLFDMSDMTLVAFRQSRRKNALTFLLNLHECVFTLVNPDAAATIVVNSLDVICDWQWL